MERLGSESERFLRYVVSGLPIWVRGELQAELRDHLKDAIQRRLEAGADLERAEAEVLAAFGPADELQRELLRVHGRHPMLHLQRSLHHLEAAFDGRAPRGFDKAILMFAQDPGYNGVRDDPCFQRLILRAAAS